MDRNEESRERLKRATNRPRRSADEPAEGGTSRERSEGSREQGEEARDKGTLDRLIDQAQEKGIFDKAEKFVRDRFGGGRGSGR